MLLSDRVGSIRNLPHTLIWSFKYNLDEVLEADLLLVVVDISHDNYKSQLETTKSVLTEIGALHIPVIHVFNKLDRADDPFLGRILRQVYPDSISISAYKPEDILKLRKPIYKFLASNFVHCKLAIPSSDKDGVSLVYRNSMILNVSYERQDLAIFEVHVTKEMYPKLASYRLQSDEDGLPKAVARL